MTKYILELSKNNEWVKNSLTTPFPNENSEPPSIWKRLLRRHRIAGFIHSTNLLSPHHLPDPFQGTCDTTVNKQIKNPTHMHFSFWCVGGKGGWREDKQQTVKKIVHICDEEKKSWVSLLLTQDQERLAKEGGGEGGCRLQYADGQQTHEKSLNITNH